MRRAAWEAFAHFGMGVNAASNDAGLDSVVVDATLPPDLRPCGEVAGAVLYLASPAAAMVMGDCTHLEVLTDQKTFALGVDHLFCLRF